LGWGDGDKKWLIRFDKPRNAAKVLAIILAREVEAEAARALLPGISPSSGSGGCQPGAEPAGPALLRPCSDVLTAEDSAVAAELSTSLPPPASPAAAASLSKAWAEVAVVSPSAASAAALPPPAGAAAASPFVASPFVSLPFVASPSAAASPSTEAAAEAAAEAAIAAAAAAVAAVAVAGASPAAAPACSHVCSIYHVPVCYIQLCTGTQGGVRGTLMRHLPCAVVAGLQRQLL
jgi:hypothetical protein